MDGGEDGIRLLLVGGADAALRTAAMMAREAGADVVLATDADTALATMRTNGVALVMIDVAIDVAAFMIRLRAERFAVRVIACGIDAPAERAVAAIRAGACDYVPLPPDRALIAAALMTAATPPAATLIGEDAAFVRALSFGRSIAPGRMPVLIRGEPETGRSALARAIHAASGRRGRFMALECAGIAADLVDADLFGYAAGAFPAATAARRGKLDAAFGGTLFIRDIDRLSPATQDRLSAALAADEGQVRLIAATAADLAERVGNNAFRADLAARLAVARIAMPPLRERPGDIAMLAAHFAAAIARAQEMPQPVFDDTALALLTAYRWPGNIRELEDVVHRATVLAHGPMIGAEHLVLADGTRLAVDTARRDEGGVDRLVGRTVEDVERALILKTLERCRGNRTSASGILGISVRTMRNKLRSFVEAGIPVAPAA